jgi:hypothetical protein
VTFGAAGAFPFHRRSLLSRSGSRRQETYAVAAALSTAAKAQVAMTCVGGFAGQRVRASASARASNFLRASFFRNVARSVAESCCDAPRSA